MGVTFLTYMTVCRKHRHDNDMCYYDVNEKAVECMRGLEDNEEK